MKILVIQQKKIGDVLFSSVLFEVLRKKYPDAELHYLVNAPTLPVLDNNPFIDKLKVFSSAIQKDVSKYYSFLRGIKKEHYDVVIDAYVKLSSGLMTSFSKADLRIGYRKSYNGFIYNEKIDRISEPRHRHSLAIENRLKLLEPLDVSFVPVHPKIYMTDDEVNTAKNLLLDSSVNLDKPLFMVSVLGSEINKTYPLSFMAKLLDYCVECNPEIQFLFNYLPRQKEEARIVYKQTSIKTQKQIYFEVFGGSLRKFLALTTHCDALIGNEGGANNMAKALGVSTFTLFSPHLTKHNWFGEVEEKKHEAVHLSDYINLDEDQRKAAKEKPEVYYKKLKPELVKERLHSFIENLREC